MHPILTAPLRRGIPTAATVLAAFFVAGAAHTQAGAQAYCGARESLLAQLYRDYRERPVAIGLSDGGTVIEVLARADGATWTIIATGPGGLSCIVQTGEGWQRIVPAPSGERS